MEEKSILAIKTKSKNPGKGQDFRSICSGHFQQLQNYDKHLLYIIEKHSFKVQKIKTKIRFIFIYKLSFSCCSSSKFIRRAFFSDTVCGGSTFSSRLSMKKTTIHEHNVTKVTTLPTIRRMREPSYEPHI
jgi:hypothetical protein